MQVWQITFATFPSIMLAMAWFSSSLHRGQWSSIKSPKRGACPIIADPSKDITSHMQLWVRRIIAPRIQKSTTGKKFGTPLELTLRAHYSYSGSSLDNTHLITVDSLRPGKPGTLTRRRCSATSSWLRDNKVVQGLLLWSSSGCQRAWPRSLEFICEELSCSSN